MFELVAPYEPAGDQPQAIVKLTNAVNAGAKHQTLLGVTGSGKTFTMANVIRNVNKPTLVISHNKTLAAQLYAEFKSFFPNNAVEYFVSYFDYYQPEAYIPRTDTFIEKDSSVNDAIERMRLSTMSSLIARRDVVVVASVSCIYGIGAKEDYEAFIVPLVVGKEISRDELLMRFIELHYSRNDIAFERGNFRVRGDVIEICPGYTEDALRIELFGDQIERLTKFDPLTGHKIAELQSTALYPSKQFVTPKAKMMRAVDAIKAELKERVAQFESTGKLLEAQRIKMRTEYDIEMMQEMGFCSGIENYSRHIANRPPGSRPSTLMDFFPDDYMLVVDESHATLPQISGMYFGDRARKETLVEHGFRLPSALDNRPLSFEEFRAMHRQAVYVSATPGAQEIEWSQKDALEIGRGIQNAEPILTAPDLEPAPGVAGRRAGVVELIVRPTGLIDPTITIKPLKGQIDDLIEEARKRVELKERVLVTTLTKRTAEELTDYLRDIGISVRYLHSEIDAIERVEILRALRKGEFDVLVGINLLREGLDLPEVSLVAILDADKEGYLRSATSLIQTAGRAARHLNGEVILYADVKTQSIQKFLAVSNYRREKQLAYNKEHNITPRSVKRAIEDSLSTREDQQKKAAGVLNDTAGNFDVAETIRQLEEDMIVAANNLEFEKAALLRDQVRELKRSTGMDTGPKPSGSEASRAVNYGKRRKAQKARM
jgi:excinuclease ABC subunit B